MINPLEAQVSVFNFSKEKDKDLFTFDYNKLKEKYFSAFSPEEDLILYKGAINGFEKKGFLSGALKEQRKDHLEEIKRSLEEGEEEKIKMIFDRHTSYYNYTPFLSATFNPQMAQTFASTSAHRMYERTIYQLKIKAKRSILESYDTGYCGESKEILILGAIFPEEITAIKIMNDDANSELLDEKNSWIKRKPDKLSKNKEVKDKNNWLKV